MRSTEPTLSPDAPPVEPARDREPPGEGRSVGPSRLVDLLGDALVWAGSAALAAVAIVVVLRIWSGSLPSWRALALIGSVAVVAAAIVNGRPGRAREAEVRPLTPVVEVAPPPGRTAPNGLLDRDGLVAALGPGTAGPDDHGVVLLFLRLDRFSRVNGHLGRPAGDDVLRQVAERLLAGAGHDVAVARTSGVGFVLAAPRRGDQGIGWATRTADAVSEPVFVDGVTVRLACACALVTTEGSHCDAATLLADAEFAVDQILRSGRGSVEEVRLERRIGPAGLARASQVQQAVEAGAINARYQPVMDLRSMQAVGAEALARWPGASPGLEGPEAFLDAVGSLGLASRVTDAILEQACSDFATGIPAELGWWVSVNIGRDECLDPTLPARIEAILGRTGLPACRLVIEVSERAIPDPVVERSLRLIAGLGVKIAIDDFGTGWSSLAQLRSLPIELVKLDRSLVSCTNEANPRLAMATIGLAEALGLRTVAEGVETGEELLLLCLAECQFGQGFWWSEALSLDGLVAGFAGQERAEVPDPFTSIFPLDGAGLEAGPEPGDVEHAAAVLHLDPLRRREDPSAEAAVADPADPLERGPLDPEWLNASPEEFLAALRGPGEARSVFGKARG